MPPERPIRLIALTFRSARTERSYTTITAAPRHRYAKGGSRIWNKTIKLGSIFDFPRVHRTGNNNEDDWFEAYKLHSHNWAISHDIDASKLENETLGMANCRWELTRLQKLEHQIENSETGIWLGHLHMQRERERERYHPCGSCGNGSRNRGNI